MKKILSKDLNPKEHYNLLISTITPRPIAWISTRGVDNSTNIAPFSFFTGISSNPPIVAISIGKKKNSRDKDTLKNIKEKKEFIIHMIDETFAKEINESALAFDYGESEIEKLKLKYKNGSLVDVPMIDGVKVAYECKLHKIVEIGNVPMSVVFGEILCYHVIDDALHDNKADEKKLKLLGRLGGKNFIKFDQDSMFEYKG